MTPKVQAEKKKTDKLDFTKIKNFCAVKKKKETKQIIKNENDPQYGKKILAIYL